MDAPGDNLVLLHVGERRKRTILERRDDERVGIFLVCDRRDRVVPEDVVRKDREILRSVAVGCEIVLRGNKRLVRGIDKQDVIPDDDRLMQLRSSDL